MISNKLYNTHIQQKGRWTTLTKSKSTKKKGKKKNPISYQIPDGWEAIGGKIKSYPNQTQKA